MAQGESPEPATTTDPRSTGRGPGTGRGPACLRSPPGLTVIAVLAVALIALPVLGLLTFTTLDLRRTVVKEGVERALGAARLAAQSQQQALLDAHSLLRALAAVPRIDAADPTACNALLERVRADHPRLANLGVVAADGTVRCSALPFTPGLNLAARGYVQRALTGGGTAAGEYQVGHITGTPSLNLGQPLRAPDGQPRGVVFAALALTRLNELASTAVLPPGSTVTLLDAAGGHLAGATLTAPGMAASGPAAASPAAPLLEAFGTGQTARWRGTDGVVRIHARVPLDGGGVLTHAPQVVVGIPQDALTEPFDAALYRTFVSVAGALVVLGVLAGVIAHRAAVRPVQRLVAAGRQIERGDLDVHVGNLRGAAELRTLGHSFDAATVRIESLVRALRLLSAGNHALVRAQDEQALLEDLCRIAVEAGGYHSAQVVYRHGAGMRVMARAGIDSGFTAALEQHWSAAQDARTPTAGAIADGTIVVLNDASQISVPQLNEAFLDRGLRAAIGLPLRVDGEVLGALTIYAAEKNVFGPPEVELLAEAAQDLAFGIATVRLRARHAAADERLRQLAYYDPVTGLANLPRFLEHLGQVSVPAGARVSLVVVHVSNYWDIAAALGPVQGDALAQAITARLRDTEPMFLARIAQAEFALLMTDGGTLEELAARARAPFQDSFPMPPILVDLDVAIGIARTQWPAAGVERQLQAARLAAYEARRGPAGWRAADIGAEQQWIDHLALASELRAALGTGAFRLHVQPQLDLRTGTVCAVEALARWNHPQRGPVPPARFIDLAETTGLIEPLTWRVLDLAADLAGRFAAAGLTLPIAVNISAHNLHDAALIPRLRALLADWWLPTERLHLELTETALMSDPIRSRQALGKLRDLGVAVYLDDFGTGYASLAYLRDLPLAGIKIDRAFISDINDPATEHIVRTVVSLAHTLDLRVVAEGIEDPARLALLADMGCDAAQGYAIARPMPGDALTAWLGAGGTPRAWAPNEAQPDVRPGTGGGD